jgi:hypothetical protein
MSEQIDTGGKVMSDDDREDCIVARCDGCKRVVYVAVNKPRVTATPEHIESVHEIIVRGGTVEHMPVFNVRKSDFGCKCDQWIKAARRREQPAGEKE